MSLHLKKTLKLFNMMFELGRAASYDNHENLIRGFPLLSYMGIGLRPRSPFEPQELRFKVAP